MDDYGDDCRGKVAELEAQRDRNYNGWCEATKEVARRGAEVEALRAQVAETERNLMRANAHLMQWESGEKERVGAYALKADLQKRLAAAEQRAEKAEAALPPADVVDAIAAIYDYMLRQAVGYEASKAAIGNWLSTLPTPEAQP